MNEHSKVALYARVSTFDQTTENQLLDLRRYCTSRGWTIVQEFVDQGISGTKKDRPALDQLMAFVRGRRCQRVLVWRYDRFARSVSHLVAALEEFRERGVQFTSYQEGIDTTTSQGEFFFTIIAGMAQFERAIIVERINAGLRRARDQGKTLGRPKTISEQTVAEVHRLHATKLSIRKIATQVGISRGRVHQLVSNNGTPNVALSLVEPDVAFANDK